MNEKKIVQGMGGIIMAIVGFVAIIGFIYHLCWGINTAFFEEKDPSTREIMIALVGTLIPPVGAAHGIYEIFVE